MASITVTSWPRYIAAAEAFQQRRVIGIDVGHDGGFIGLRIEIRFIRGAVHLGFELRAQRGDFFICDETVANGYRSVWRIGSRPVIACNSVSPRYLRWSSEEEWGSSRTTFASSRAGPAPWRMASITDGSVSYMCSNQVPSNWNAGMPKPWAIDAPRSLSGWFGAR